MLLHFDKYSNFDTPSYPPTRYIHKQYKADNQYISDKYYKFRIHFAKYSKSDKYHRAHKYYKSHIAKLRTYYNFHKSGIVLYSILLDKRRNFDSLSSLQNHRADRYYKSDKSRKPSSSPIVLLVS